MLHKSWKQGNRNHDREHRTRYEVTMRCLDLSLRLLGTLRCTLGMTLWYPENYTIRKLLGLWCTDLAIFMAYMSESMWHGHSGDICIKVTSGRKANHVRVESWFSGISVVHRVHKERNSMTKTMNTHCWQLSHMTSEVIELHNKQFPLIVTITTSNGKNNHRKHSSV